MNLNLETGYPAEVFVVFLGSYKQMLTAHEAVGDRFCPYDPSFEFIVSLNAVLLIALRKRRSVTDESRIMDPENEISNLFVNTCLQTVLGLSVVCYEDYSEREI